MLEVYLFLVAIVFFTRFFDVLARTHSSIPLSDHIVARVIRAFIWPLHVLALLHGYIRAKKIMNEYK